MKEDSPSSTVKLDSLIMLLAKSQGRTCHEVAAELLYKLKEIEKRGKLNDTISLKELLMDDET